MSGASAGGHAYLDAGEYEAWHGVVLLGRAVLAELDARLAETCGLSVSAFDVLITLYNAPDRRLGMTALAEAVLLSPSGLTHLVTRLERDGLVSRTVSPEDRRKWFTELTEAGDRALREARPTHNAVLREAFLTRLRPAERKVLAALGRRLYRAPGRT